MGQHSYSCLACLGCSWSPQKELPLRLQTMLGTAILIETPPAQLSSLIPACDHWCQDLCCGLCSFMEHACVAPAHCWVTSPQSMNYASSTQSHDTCSHSNPTLSFASQAHPPLYGVWVLSQPLTNNLVRVKAWPGNAASSHFRFSLPRARDSVPRPEGTALCHLPPPSYPSSCSFQSLPPTMTPRAPQI